MWNLVVFIFSFVCVWLRILKPGGVRTIAAENIALRKQLITLTRHKKRSPKLSTHDRIFFGLLTSMIGAKRLSRIAIALKPATGLEIDKDVVRRVLSKHYKNYPENTGPSWLTFIGHMKDSLWSVDLFRVESITLKTHWIMVVMDQHTRRIIGFSVHAGDLNGVAICGMFNKIKSGQKLPKYLSSDNDPLFRFHRWLANLRIMEVDTQRVQAK